MFQIHYPQENFFSIINANFTGIPPEDSESGIPEVGGGTDGKHCGTCQQGWQLKCGSYSIGGTVAR